MLSKHDFGVAKQIIEGLHLPRELGVEEECNEFYTDYISDQIGRVYSGDFSIENGVSKAVIVLYDEDFVIKIPFNGMLRYEWNDEEDDYDYDNPQFDYFTGANAPDETDYCWNEVLSIEMAEMMGYGQLFPATEFIMEHEGRRFYMQEKVRLVFSYQPTFSQDSRTKAEDMEPCYQCGTTDWRAAVVEYYGEEFWTKFVEWDHSCKASMLSDMHSGNYGYNMDGHPVILDVSGFRY